jgi:hypothetical protein
MTLVHKDFETIERENQTYRITTEVEYVSNWNAYKCSAFLHKSYGGKARNQIANFNTKVSDKEKIDTELTSCVKKCKREIDKIEEAKDMNIEVNISEV